MAALGCPEVVAPRLSASASTALEVGGILSVHTGFPLTVTGSDASNTGSAAARGPIASFRDKSTATGIRRRAASHGSTPPPTRKRRRMPSAVADGAASIYGPNSSI